MEKYGGVCECMVYSSVCDEGCMEEWMCGVCVGCSGEECVDVVGVRLNGAVRGSGWYLERCVDRGRGGVDGRVSVDRDAYKGVRA